jgi:N-acetylglucosaminyldiphosphoundecaprenol N-acetyl-beta-D-mannosaminyltransferase
MPSSNDPPTFDVLGVPVRALDLPRAIAWFLDRAARREKAIAIFRDVHGVVRCQDDPDFLRIHREAALVCPDGMPLVWLGRRRGHRDMGRVYGPDLMRALFEATRDGSASHFLFGGKAGVAERLKQSLEQQYPGCRIAGIWTPPFGPMTDGEDASLRATLADCRPDFFWVGLGTPKQERFMDASLDRLDATVFLGVGAAFDYLSGEVREPPAWLRRLGLQWLARIFQEPRRLFHRYLVTVPRFLALLACPRLRSDQNGASHP